ncbi:MAG: hypothetical protein RBS40_12315 [Rhodocyclaceae bacterium]|nr:hypothetical protein [Rhodocyclaceae bacterium]
MEYAMGILRGWKSVCLTGLLAATFGQATASPSPEHPPGCAIDTCGLRQSTGYEHLIIGPLAGIATNEEMSRLFQWAKPRIWRDFQEDEADYLRRNRLFILPADEAGTPVMVHMSHEEFRRVSFEPGDLVRYIPHIRGAHPGVDESLYSDLAGCIAVLCRASDQACISRYRTGVFRRTDGIQIDFKTGRPQPGGVVIDPVSLLPSSDGGGQAQSR